MHTQMENLERGRRGAGGGGVLSGWQGRSLAVTKLSAPVFVCFFSSSSSASVYISSPRLVLFDLGLLKTRTHSEEKSVLDFFFFFCSYSQSDFF